MHYITRKNNSFRHSVIEREFERERLAENTEESEVDNKQIKPLNDSDYGLDGLKSKPPLEVLREVFLMMDTIDRLRCRRICSLWEAILKSVELCQDVRVAQPSPDPSLPQTWSFDYIVYACLFKYVTPATHTICFSKPPETYSTWDMRDDYWADIPQDRVEGLLHYSGTQGVGRLILHQRSIKISPTWIGASPWNLGTLIKGIAEHLSLLLLCCDRVIWKDYVLTMLSYQGTPLIEFRIPVAVFTREQIKEEHIVELLEQHLHCEGPLLDVQRIDQYMRLVGEMADDDEMVREVTEA
ncbi:uncharacterized protein LOC129585252 [Paramacrobiotus metropolitanus]|uniref:uncharacterized protein LOC129585252 n=1 Tax=Paramacrobiotus metropolitanus TaxID=2943436 RepID=UPI00244659FD|nr:uncharacterized protein LOC129585252 [Paramacrobiotus metropolitanus]